MSHAVLDASDSGLRYALLAAGLSFIFIKLIVSYVSYIRSPLRDLPGPKASVWNWVFGDMKVLMKEFDRVAVQQRWENAYGHVFKYKGYFNADGIHTIDARALNYSLTRSEDFAKSEQSRRNLACAPGNGLLVVKGEAHRRQRRIMNPAFGPAQIRELTSIFVHKSIIFRDKWAATIAQSGSAARINVLNGLNQMTLDVIGMAGFSHDIDALGGTTGTTAGHGFLLIVIAKMYFPTLKFIPDRMSNRSSHAQAIMRRVSMQLLTEKAALLSKGAAKGGVERKDIVRRDLLTLLIKANVAADVPDNQRLTDEEVLGQILTFFVAGHDTTSTATTWCLFALAQHPSIQAKLRAELLALDTDLPTMNQLNALPCLDCVVRESLCVYAPVPRTECVALYDVAVPLDTPFTDVHGNVQHTLKVPKGCFVEIPILAMHRSKALWGEDALEFKCETVDKVFFRGSKLINLSSTGFFYDTARFRSADETVLTDHNPARVEFTRSLASDLRQSNLYGGPHGSYFNNLPSLPSTPKVASITLRGANCLDVISFTFTSGAVLAHGGMGGDATTLTLATGEQLVSATLCWDKYKGDTRNFYASLMTSSGPTLSAGKTTDSCATATAPDGFGIVGAYGQNGDEMDQVGWIYAKQ
ncbi:cytochrome P450 [Trametes maxima]|nr:cytochrome P450 [Trametes maxima]